MTLSVDSIVILVFSLLVLVIGLLFSNTGRNLKSFFAGGEAVPWFVGGLSLFMSFFSAGTFVAWGSIAYKYGWVAISIQWTMCIGALFTAFWLAPLWKATGSLTAAEFIRDRLGLRVQKVFILIFTLVNLFLKGAVLYPVAKLVSTSLQLPLMPTTIVLGVFMISYTAVGGLWAVMVTDILQFVVLCAAVFILLPLSLDRVGGLASFIDKTPPNFFAPLNDEYTLGFIVAFTLYHTCFIGGNWTFVQRYTSVDSAASARKVAFLFAGLYLISPIIWMLPPMIYRAINPDLVGLDTENAYLKVCQLVLPPGLLGLMLTGMYFSTSASANTALNVVSAVFTNDVYKGLLNPHASDRQLIRVARLSSWVFGIGMILIAIMIPYVGGMVEVVLSIGAVAGGPLLAPPIWALFSKRLSGSATLFISLSSLSVNLIFKLILPLLINFKLSRTYEMALGVALPFVLLALYEWVWTSKKSVSNDFLAYQQIRQNKRISSAEVSLEELQEVRKQNRFGLIVITWALVITAAILFVLSTITDHGGKITAIIALLILISSAIPYFAQKKMRLVSGN